MRPLHVPGDRTVVAHGSVEQHLVHMQVRIPVAVVPLRCRAGGTRRHPSAALDITPCGYPQHPFGTVHAKIIFSMKANGVLDLISMNLDVYPEI
jgi:hypothetical protein